MEKYILFVSFLFFVACDPNPQESPEPDIKECSIGVYNKCEGYEVSGRCPLTLGKPFRLEPVPPVSGAIGSVELIGNLPSGLVWDRKTGVVSGTPDKTFSLASIDVIATCSSGKVSHQTWITLYESK